MTKLITIATFLVFATLTTTMSDSEVSGTYYKYFTPGIDGGSDYFLTIKKDNEFNEIVNTTIHGKTRKTKTTGTWTIKGDTIILVPKTIKTSGTKYDCFNEIDNESKGVWCSCDTLIYKENGLWNYPGQTHKVYSKNK